MSLGPLAQVVDDRSSLERALAERERELAVLEGRYSELQERAQRLDEVLQTEMRRAALLEARLELNTPSRRAA